MTNSTLTKAMDQFEQMVLAVEQWRHTLAEGTSERVLFDDESKIHLEKFAKIYKIVVGHCRALAVEDCTLAKGTILDSTTIYTSSIIDPEQIMKVTNSAPAMLFNGWWVQVPGCLQSSGLVHNDAFERQV